jgi:tetratricopeptide (TPR) repeat protein
VACKADATAEAARSAGPNEWVRGRGYDDTRLGLTWPLPVTEISDKDVGWPSLSEFEPELARSMIEKGYQFVTIQSDSRLLANASLVVQQLAGRLGWLWLLRGLAAEGERWLDEGLGAVDGAPPDGLDVADADQDALLWASGLRVTGLSPHGLRWAGLAVDAAAAPDREVLAKLFAAVHRAHRGDVEAALTDLDAAVEHAADIGGWLLGFAHLITAQIGRLTGRADDVRHHAESALELLDDEAVDWARAQAIDVVIDVIGPDTGPAQARRLATEGLALCRRRDFPELEGRMLLQLGVATHAAGDPELARSYLDEAVALTAEVAPGPGLGFALLVAGAHARERGELDGSRQHLVRARELLGGTGAAYGSARAALELGRTLLALGAVDQATPIIDEGFDLARQVGDPEVLAGFDALLAAREH